MMYYGRNYEAVRNGIIDILLNHSWLYAALRDQKGVNFLSVLFLFNNRWYKTISSKFCVSGKVYIIYFFYYFS